LLLWLFQYQHLKHN